MHHNTHHIITLDNTACKYIKLVYSTIFTLNVEDRQSNTEMKEQHPEVSGNSEVNEYIYLCICTQHRIRFITGPDIRYLIQR